MAPPFNKTTVSTGAETPLRSNGRRVRMRNLVATAAAIGWCSFLHAATTLRYTEGLTSPGAGTRKSMFRTPTTSITKPVTLAELSRRKNEESNPSDCTNDDASAVLLPSTSTREPLLSCRTFSNRREIFAAAIGLPWTYFASLGQPSIAWADSPEVVPTNVLAASDVPLPRDFPNRNRNGNRDALIREDYWYMLGRTPPRLLTGPIGGANDPQWNAFGSCRSDDPGSATGPNPCTYVSLNLRIPAYNRYASSITYGSQQYGQLGSLLQKLRQANDAGGRDLLRQEALGLLRPTSTTTSGSSSASFPSPIVDAELKLILFATAMTTSPNFPQPSRELLIARYYANEVHFADAELLSVLSDPNPNVGLAMELWEYGRDSWNSYFQIVNQHITAKVGDPFGLV